ncbi:hypothetical protein K504DRAFT_365551 [Pleomassaria siparia CBS 279.74]|uniref:N-terminal of MaoC-like dehydratase domain-containing protein n=1 Tax=Pleomassaria siparia CBS 279.74 TaxID=1314801 RepID=A0A6G1KTT4_9PLEO|nr:hypothetical protein K504DRAFT_365551 [Pleomassaria siparia CBS 279.74]
MLQVTRRFFTSTTSRSASAEEACVEIFQRFGDKPISVRRQKLDMNQLRLLKITLSHSEQPEACEKLQDEELVAPGHHIVYFTPPIPERELGRDGTDRTVNPLSPFTRRMWAGGELHWEKDNPMKVGNTVYETTRILTAEPKQLKNGGEMIVVGVEKTYENSKGVVLRDNRNWVFQKELADTQDIPPTPEEKPLPEGTHTRDFCQTEVSLFRFSALTFNGHKIHYSPEWCRKVEGHRKCVVHGPLNLINMLDFWRDTAHAEEKGTLPKSIRYRAMSPLYMSEPYRILLHKEEKSEKDGEWNAEIWDSYGKIGMKGIIVG